MRLGKDSGANYSKGSFGPKVAVDGSGNATAVWSQADAIGTKTVASRYIAGSGWSAPVAIETGSGTAWSQRVAMDPLGNAIAVWERDSDERDGGLPARIWANHYDSTAGWGVATPIGGTGTAYEPQIAMDSQGNSIVVWGEWDGFRGTAWASR